MNFLDPRSYDADQLIMTYAMTAVCLVLWVMYWVRGKRVKRLEKQLKYSRVRVVTEYENGRPIRSDSKPVGAVIDNLANKAKEFLSMANNDPRRPACGTDLYFAILAYRVAYHGEGDDGTLPLPLSEQYENARILGEQFKDAIKNPPTTRMTDQDDKR